MQFWMRFALVLVLALAAWICGLDSNGAPVEAIWLWAATALAGAHLVYRSLARTR
jgi:hypothetical protein